MFATLLYYIAISLTQIFSKHQKATTYIVAPYKVSKIIRTNLGNPFVTLLNKSSVSQILKIFRFASKPEQPGHSSSIRFLLIIIFSKVTKCVSEVYLNDFIHPVGRQKRKLSPDIPTYKQADRLTKQHLRLTTNHID